jgi:hypothetical protein
MLNRPPWVAFLCEKEFSPNLFRQMCIFFINFPGLWEVCWDSSRRTSKRLLRGVILYNLWFHTLTDTDQGGIGAKAYIGPLSPPMWLREIILFESLLTSLRSEIWSKMCPNRGPPPLFIYSFQYLLEIEIVSYYPFFPLAPLLCNSALPPFFFFVFHTSACD